MICFNCNQCGKTFKVPDEYGGRTAKCKICGNAVKVPELKVAAAVGVEPVHAAVHAAGIEPVVETARTTKVPVEKLRVEKTLLEKPAAPAPSKAPGKIPMRTRRLRADAEVMRSAFADFDAIRVTPLVGNPPEAYRVRYHIQSLQSGPDGEPIPQPEHEIEIQLTSDYPRLSPSCKILTPIFHPNFDATTICVGDHWTAGERLVDLVIRIGEMIAFQAYNIQSPLDAQAAMWADLNRDKLPTDSRNLRPVDLE